MPIQLIPMSDNSSAPADAIGDLGNMLFRAQQSKVQQQQHAAEMLMQQQEAQDKRQQHQQLMAEHERQLRAAAIEEVMQHKDNPAMMNLVAQKYGVPLNDVTPKPQNIPMAASPAPGQSPISMQQLMSMDASPPDQPAPAASAPFAPGGDSTVRVREPITITGGQQGGEQEHLNYAHQLLTHDNAVAEQGNKVEQFQQAEQAAKNGAVPGAPSPVYQLGFTNNPVTIDTGAITAGEESNKAERLKRFKIALADNPDAQKLATMMVHLGQPDDAIAKALVDTGKIDQRMGGRIDLLERQINSRTDLQGEAEHARQVLEAQKAAERMALEGKQEAGGKYAGGASATGPGGFNPKIEAANRMALKNLNTQTNTTAMRAGLPQMGKAVAGLDETEALIKSGNPVAAAAALERFVAVSRSGTGNGAAATNAALALFQRHMGGISDTIEGAVEKLKSGNLGEEQKLNLVGAVRTARDSIKQSANQFHQSFVNTWYNEGNANIKGNVEDQEETLFGPLGYHPQRDPNAKRIRPMSGQLPSADSSGSTRPAGMKPDAGAVTPQDQAMYQKAKAALSNPDLDAETRASAQRVIDHIERKIANLR